MGFHREFNVNPAIPSNTITTILGSNCTTRWMNMTAKTVEITDASFDSTLKNDSLVVVDCWAPWCGPCRMIAPVIDQLSEQYSNVTFGKLNTDDNFETSRKFQIMAIPTLLFFKNGELVERITGVVPKEHIEGVIKKYI